MRAFGQVPISRYICRPFNDAPSSNWQDSGFWFRQSRFESLWGNKRPKPRSNLRGFFMARRVTHVWTRWPKKAGQVYLH